MCSLPTRPLGRRAADTKPRLRALTSPLQLLYCTPAANWHKFLILSFFLDSPFGCRCLTLALATTSTTTSVTPESWESASPYSRGLYAISAAPLRVIRDFILAFPALFCSSRSSVILLLLSYKMIPILYRTMGCKPRADLYPSPCLFARLVQQ